jgi:G protein-coupled receptor 158
MGRPLKIGWHTYTHNSTAHTDRSPDKILTVRYEDGAWTKPYYDCGGGNIWMMTYTVPFFGFENGQYVFKGTSGIDIDLRRVDIDQCPSEGVSEGLNIFRGTDKCKKKTTFCEPVSGLGFRRGSYKCVCKIGYYFPNTTSENRFFNGTDVEDEAAKLEEGEESYFDEETAFQCLLCAAGCESCVDSSPCIVTLNWVLRTILLILQCVIIGCLPVVVLFTYKYKEIKVVRAASPVLLRIIILGAFFIYSTTIILYPTPNIVTCTMRIWLREIGFALAYGALMLKTWRISVIFRVKSAKAVKITDMDLIKRLGLIVGVFVLFLLIRTLVSPPVVYTGTTSENLKAFLCSSDWWDHSFTILEFLFLLWGIRLCIMVRKAPSEFNESRFISMTIYNEFLLSIFLNVSVFFLQKPANPDLLYIIFFCHSQLTISILLCLIFASKVSLKTIKVHIFLEGN